VMVVTMCYFTCPVFTLFSIPEPLANHHWQSLGWEHYEVHEPEPHILLFKRPLNYQPPVSQ
jgi:hypothetical protein